MKKPFYKKLGQVEEVLTSFTCYVDCQAPNKETSFFLRKDETNIPSLLSVVKSHMSGNGVAS